MKGSVDGLLGPATFAGWPRGRGDEAAAGPEGEPKLPRASMAIDPPAVEHIEEAKSGAY